MNTKNCNDLLQIVTQEFRNRFSIVSLDSDCVLVTPFLNSDVAPVEIYIEITGDSIRLTDEGEALNQLFASGLTIDRSSRYLSQVQLISELNEVQFTGSELSILSTKESLSDDVCRLANAIQAVSFLVYKRSHRQYPKFQDEVERLLMIHEVKYQSTYDVQGYANTHIIPFYINSTRNVLVEPLTASSISSARNKAKQVAYKWSDLRHKFGDDYKYTVVIDDAQTKHREIWSDQEAQSALVNYSTSVFSWTDQQAAFIDTLVREYPNG